MVDPFENCYLFGLASGKITKIWFKTQSSIIASYNIIHFNKIFIILWSLREVGLNKR